MNEILQQIHTCNLCAPLLNHGVRPVMAAGSESKILIIGQAPGRIVHQTGIPWNDKSGENLRRWLDIDRNTFYNVEHVSIMPMGFCYPGTGPSGDLPPRPECAPLWHPKLLQLMPKVRLVLLIGLYAQNYYLGARARATLTETVQNFKAYLPTYFPLPHPSPRNNLWQAKNKWFEQLVLPELKEKVRLTLA